MHRSFRIQFLNHEFAQFVNDWKPNFNDSRPAFFASEQAFNILRVDGFHFFFRLRQQIFLFLGNMQIIHSPRDSGVSGVFKSNFFYFIQNHGCLVDAAFGDQFSHNAIDRFFLHFSVEKTDFQRQNLIKNKTARASFHEFVTLFDFGRAFHVLDRRQRRNFHFYFRAQINLTVMIIQNRFFGRNKIFSFALEAVRHFSHPINSKNHILARRGDRIAGGRFQKIVGRKHDFARFILSFRRQRQMNGHLVAVKIGVKSRAN